jgi:putative transcriptional regulator
MPAVSRKVAESIERGLRQALAFVEGTADLSQYRVHTPQSIKARAARKKHATKKRHGKSAAV